MRLAALTGIEKVSLTAGNWAVHWAALTGVVKVSLTAGN